MKVFSQVILGLLLVVNLSTAQTTVGLLQHDAGSLDDGYVLFAPISSTNTYLIDKCGKQIKTWNSAYRPGQSCYLLTDGTLLRTGNANNTTFNAGGKGGIIQKIDWDGNISWTYTISSTQECQHHDIKPLPNGNVLAIVWESKTNTEAIAQGRNPALTTTTVWSEKIIEIEPVGADGGIIVWEWHLWDHLVQNYDNTKSNYGDIESNPALLNINFNASGNANMGTDWIHLNSIDYNPALDQILLSSHGIEEIWIIDHSTTTAEAASHTGGNSGKGGDILYRWGNPQAYNVGSAADQQFFLQHDARWLETGLLHENQIMVFNNGNGRPGGNYSTVEIINPPVSGYNYTASLPYLPAATSWVYNAGNPNNFYAQNISGAQELSNGNVLMCDGPAGVFTEVNQAGETVWKYVNPVSNAGFLTQGVTPVQNLVFRCSFYPSDYSGFAGHSLVAGSILETVNTVSASCNLTSTVAENTVDNDAIKIYPNPATESVNIHLDGTRSEKVNLRIFDVSGTLVQENNTFAADNLINLDLSRLNSGWYYLHISTGGYSTVKQVVVLGK